MNMHQKRAFFLPFLSQLSRLSLTLFPREKVRNLPSGLAVTLTDEILVRFTTHADSCRMMQGQ